MRNGLALGIQNQPFWCSMSRVGVSRKGNWELVRRIRIDLIGGVVFERRAAGAVGDEAGAGCGECCCGCRQGDVAVFARRCPVAVVPFEGQNVQFERAKALGPRSAFDTPGSLAASATCGQPARREFRYQAWHTLLIGGF